MRSCVRACLRVPVRQLSVENKGGFTVLRFSIRFSAYVPEAHVLAFLSRLPAALHNIANNISPHYIVHIVACRVRSVWYQYVTMTPTHAMI